MKIAEKYRQPPHLVAAWPPDWLAVAETAIAAENGAEAELQKRQQRRSKRPGAR